MCKNNHFDEKLKSISEDVLESLAFFMPMDDDEEPPPHDTEDASASVVFTGPVRGGLSVSLPKDSLATLAENMLGLDEDAEISPSEQSDAFGELVNVLCGNLLPEVFGKEEIFDIGSPAILDESAQTDLMKNFSKVSTASVNMDVGKITILLYLETPDFIPGGCK